MEVLENIIDHSAEVQRVRVFEELYEKAFPPFARFAARMHAPFYDAKDIFHDALVIYYEKSRDADFIITTSAEAYILGIAKHLWIRKFNRDRHKISLDALAPGISLPADYFPSVNDNRLLNFLERSGKKCLDLLQKFYYEKMLLKDIADMLGYRNEHSAAVQKFKCIEKVRDAIKTQSIDYEDFVD